MPEHSWLGFLWFHKDKAQLVVYGLLFLYCLARAAAPERVLSGVLFAMLAVDKLHHMALGGSFLVHRTNVGHVVIDLAVMASVFAVALRANRVYPLWIGGAQIIALLGHLYRFALEEINRFAYDVMAITPSYIQFIAMILGLAFHMSRHRKLGNYPSWRRSSRPMPVPPERASPSG